MNISRVRHLLGLINENSRSLSFVWCDVTVRALLSSVLCSQTEGAKNRPCTPSEQTTSFGMGEDRPPSTPKKSPSTFCVLFCIFAQRNRRKKQLLRRSLLKETRVFVFNGASCFVCELIATVCWLPNDTMPNHSRVVWLTSNETKQKPVQQQLSLKLSCAILILIGVYFQTHLLTSPGPLVGSLIWDKNS